MRWIRNTAFTMYFNFMVSMKLNPVLTVASVAIALPCAVEIVRIFVG